MSGCLPDITVGDWDILNTAGADMLLWMDLKTATNCKSQRNIEGQTNETIKGNFRYVLAGRVSESIH